MECVSDYKLFRERLLEACKQKNITLERLGRSIGMGPRGIIGLERVIVAELTAHRLCQIAERLDVSIDWLLGRTDKPEVNI